MYGCESWTIKKAEHWRIDAFEPWSWRRLLRVPWTARRSGQSILKEINPKYLLEGLMLKLNLQYFGHLKQRTDSLSTLGSPSPPWDDCLSSRAPVSDSLWSLVEALPSLEPCVDPASALHLHTLAAALATAGALWSGGTPLKHHLPPSWWEQRLPTFSAVELCPPAGAPQNPSQTAANKPLAWVLDWDWGVPWTRQFYTLNWKYCTVCCLSASAPLSWAVSAVAYCSGRVETVVM